MSPPTVPNADTTTLRGSEGWKDPHPKDAAEQFGSQMTLSSQRQAHNFKW